MYYCCSWVEKSGYMAEILGRHRFVNRIVQSAVTRFSFSESIVKVELFNMPNYVDDKIEIVVNAYERC